MCFICLFFIVYTNVPSQFSSNCKIIKYANGIVVSGLISNNSEDNDRLTISCVYDWCSENFLNLNVTKTKDMILDISSKQNSKTPICGYCFLI